VQPLLLSHTTHESDGVLPFTAAGGVNATISDYLTLALFQCPVAATAGYWSAHNVTTYRYLYNGSFAATTPYSWMQPYHGSDLTLILGQEELKQYEDPSPALVEAGKYMRNAIASFVKDPHHGLASLGWKQYAEDGE
jgi:Carboxylesterase family